MFFSANPIDDISYHLNDNSFCEFTNTEGKKVSIQYDSKTDFHETVEPVIASEIGSNWKRADVSGLLFFPDFIFKNNIQQLDLIEEN